MDPQSTQSAIWLKLGDHMLETERICTQNRAEHGGKLVGEPSSWMSKYKGSEGFVTFLEATGPWWHEYMAVHGWKGPVSEDDFLDIFDPEPPV